MIVMIEGERYEIAQWGDGEQAMYELSSENEDVIQDALYAPPFEGCTVIIVRKSDK